MSLYGYEYFCGANVILEIEGMPILEAVGLSVSIQESKIPLYGYSSRFFDAVARGQVLVQGTILVNYVHQNYLFQAIKQGVEKRQQTFVPTGEDLIGQGTLIDTIGKTPESQIPNVDLWDRPTSLAMKKAYETKYWGQNDLLRSSDPIEFLPNPHDMFGGVDIMVTFGDRDDETGYLGHTGFFITDVYFLGRGTSFQIDENVIVEEYTFFGRNIYPVRPKRFVNTVEEGSESTSTIEPATRLP